jgi:2-polyprenyl-3-methyl-5-hydroxy-6-metoxy-1,4-benzoquinol methylase
MVPEGPNNILDVGGGVGANAEYLKNAGKAERFSVVDLAAENVLPSVDSAFKGNLEDPDLINRIGREAGPFDVILCLDVLEHLSDPWSVVDLLTGIMVGGGTLVASIPNARNYRLTFPLFFKGQFELQEEGIMDRTHLRWFVCSTARDLMSRNGLQIVEIRKNLDSDKKKKFNNFTFGVFEDFLTLQFFIKSVKNT